MEAQSPALSIPETKPTADSRIGLARRLRKDVAAALEYLWELSGSARHHRADAVLVEGKERETGLPLTAFYFGHYDNYAFILSRLFSAYRVVTKHTGRNSFQVRRWIAEYSRRASLLCIDSELLFCKLLPRSEYLEIPQWVRQKYNVPDSWEEVLKSFRKNTRRTDLRKVRKFGFTYRITGSEEDYREFYHRMYIPYLRKRFADEVIIEPEWKVLRQCRKGELMHIVRDERVVAAVLLHLLGGRLAYVWVGVPEDLDNDLYTGVFSAMYYFTILYGYTRGCHLIDFLGSRPLLNDGLFRYKRKWGTYVEDSPVPRGDILLKPLQFTEPVRGFFRTNHFVVRDGNALAGKILLDAGPATAENLQSIHEDLYTEGLAELKVYSMAGFEPCAHAWLENSGVAMRLINLSESANPAEAYCRL
jgi:hypothetical protein